MMIHRPRLNITNIDKYSGMVHLLLADGGDAIDLSVFDFSSARLLFASVWFEASGRLLGNQDLCLRPWRGADVDFHIV